METTLAVMERQQQFDFQKNGIEVMNFETLQRTYKAVSYTHLDVYKRQLYSQFELLYNNSINMVCWSSRVYHENRDKEIEEDNNPHYGDRCV